MSDTRPKPERNERVYLLHEAGLSQAMIARLEGITYQRVGQIIHARSQDRKRAMIGVGITSGSKVHYIEEHGPEPLTFSDPQAADVVARAWDVNDAGALRAAAEEQLGEGANDDDHYCKHAMWFVNPDINSAVLIVFRPKAPAYS